MGKCPACGSDRSTSAGGIVGTDGATYGLRLCAVCGLRSLSEYPDEESMSRCYGEEYYSQNTVLHPTRRSLLKMRLEESDSPLVRRVLRSLAIGWLPRAPQPGMRMLDVGCGDGAAMARAASLGWEAEGCEVDDAACGRARARGFTCYAGDWASQLVPKSYDLVVMNQVLEHLPDPMGTLMSVRASMKEGGRLLLGLPNWDSSWSRVFGTAWWANLAPQHLWHFRISHVRSMLSRSGFGIESVRVRNALIDVLSVGHARTQWTAASAAGWARARILRDYPLAAGEAIARRIMRVGSVVGEGSMYTLECAAATKDSRGVGCE